MYNLVGLKTTLCEEDLTIFYTPGEGILNDVDPIDYREDIFVYKLCLGSTYVLGPHKAISCIGDAIHVDTTYNVYRVLRFVPCVPYITYMGNMPQAAELIEVEIKRSSNRLEYYDFLYGD